MNIHKSQPFMRVSRRGLHGFRPWDTNWPMGFQVPIIDNFVCQTCGFILPPKTWILTTQLWMSTIQNVDSDHSLGLIHRGLGIHRHETLIFVMMPGNHVTWWCFQSCDTDDLPFLFLHSQFWAWVNRGDYISLETSFAHTLPGKVLWRSKTMMMKC